MSRRLTLIVAAVATAVVLAFGLASNFGAWGNDVTHMGDFRPPYCDGVVVRAGGDPYRAEPIGACERRLAGNSLPRRSDFTATPPIPPYDVALFVPLALLPYAAASALWMALVALNFLYMLRACIEATAVRPTAVFAALLPLGLLVPVSYGVAMPFVVSCALAAALALREGHERRAAAFAAATLFEPHIGLPICLTIASLRPGTRVTLASALAVLTGVGLLALGWERSIEYTHVVPAHVAAELDYDGQLSTAYLLRWIGAPADAALWIANVGYWIVIVASIYVARLSWRRSNDAATLVLLPMAASIAAGPYLHFQNLLAAVPLALCVAGNAVGSLRIVAWASVAAISWPFVWLAQTLGFLGAVPLYGGVLPEYARGPGAIGAVAWRLIVAPASGHAGYFLAKIPTWMGLAATLLLEVTNVFGRQEMPTRRTADRPSA